MYEMVEVARKDLAFQLKIPAEDIKINSIEKVVWPDTCLGGKRHSRCGILVSVPGYKVVFYALDQRYEYHIGGEYYTQLDMQ
jgi:hypothetical protein